MNELITDVVEELHKFFRNKGLTLSVAESCTGGLICHYITNIPGASNFFISGIVAYSAEVKKNVLGIASETLNKYGIVSAETARAMAERVRVISKTDYAISTTGNLGPDVLEGKEKGLVYVAAVRDGKALMRELRLTGNRAENKEQTVLDALQLVMELAYLD